MHPDCGHSYSLGRGSWAMFGEGSRAAVCTQCFLIVDVMCPVASSPWLLNFLTLKYEPEQTSPLSYSCMLSQQQEKKLNQKGYYRALAWEVASWWSTYLGIDDPEWFPVGGNQYWWNKSHGLWSAPGYNITTGLITIYLITKFEERHSML